ncbi:MAG: hypothetical protein IKG58_03435 [Bacilli bacterium]|nr:hypothetical protein [Bacilli bacterium]
MKRFENVKTKEDIIKICSELSVDLPQYCDEQIIEEGVKSSVNLDKEKEKILIKLANQSDKYYKKAIEDDLDSHKVNSIMAGTIILDKYFDIVKDLNTEELLNLSYLMCSIDLKQYEKYLKIFNKDILDAALKKKTNYLNREYILEAPLILLEEGKLSENEVKDYIENTSYTEMYEYVDHKLNTEYLEECKKQGVRPI